MSWDETLVTAQPTFDEDEHTDAGDGGVDPAWFERKPANAKALAGARVPAGVRVPAVPDRPLWVTREVDDEPAIAPLTRRARRPDATPVGARPKAPVKASPLDKGWSIEKATERTEPVERVEPDKLLDLATLLEPDPEPEPLPAPPIVSEPPILPIMHGELEAPSAPAIEAEPEAPAIEVYAPAEAYVPAEPYTPAAEVYTPAAEVYTPAAEVYTPASAEPYVPVPQVEPHALEQTDDVARAVERPDGPAAEARKRGKIVVFFGCRGGCGATTLAVNTASVLARAGREVCVVDLDLLLGDVLVTLDLEPKISVTAMARDGVTMDGAALRRRLQRHDAGFYALAQTGRIDDMDTEIAERVPDLMRTLAQHFDVVLVDGLRDFSDHAVAALDAANEVALVFTQDVAGVRRAARVVELCRKLGYDDGKLRLVVNRQSSSARVRLPEVERALALPIAACVANDYGATNAAQDAGAVLTDLRPRSRVARDVAALAAGLFRRDEAPAARRPGFWARLIGRKS